MSVISSLMDVKNEIIELSKVLDMLGLYILEDLWYWEFFREA